MLPKFGKKKRVGKDNVNIVFLWEKTTCLLGKRQNIKNLLLRSNKPVTSKNIKNRSKG